MSYADALHELSDARKRIAELEAENERLRNALESAKLHGAIHKMEARGANQSLSECYQAATGSTGEPGNWNGANPVRERIAELEQQLAAAQAELAALREPVEGLRLTPSSVEADLESFEDNAAEYREGTLGERDVYYASDWLAMHRIIAQQREQLSASDARCAELEREITQAGAVIADYIRSKRDGWVRTADRLPTEADAPHGVEAAEYDAKRDYWFRDAFGSADEFLHDNRPWTWWTALPAPPADEKGGDDANG